MRKANVVVPAIALLGLLGAGCGSDGPAAPSGPDVITVTIAGSPLTSFSEDDPDVGITAAANTNGGINVDLFAPGLTLRMTLDAPLPASVPATNVGHLTCIVVGTPYTNSAVSFNVTSLGGGMGGIVEGTIPVTTLSGAGTITISGSFRATLIN